MKIFYFFSLISFAIYLLPIDIRHDDTHPLQTDGEIPAQANSNIPEEYNESDTPNLQISKFIRSCILDNGDGSFTIDYRIILENISDEVFSDSLILNDDLAAAFEGVDSLLVTDLHGGNLNIDRSFDGINNTNILLGINTFGSRAKFLYMEIIVWPGDAIDRPFTNVVIGSVRDSLGNMIVLGSDASTISLNKIALSSIKYLTQRPQDNQDGSWTLSYTIEIANCGSSDIDSIQFYDDLVRVFSTSDSFYVLGVAQSGDLIVNPGFNGRDDLNLLPGYETLQPGDNGAVTFSITVFPGDSSIRTYKNISIATGVLDSIRPVADTSCSASVTITNPFYYSNIIGDVLDCNGEPTCDFDVFAFNRVDSTNRQESADKKKDGFYMLPLPKGQNWSISIELDDEVLNGVTMQDYSILLRHVLGLEEITNPYKLVAADINGDRQIDIRDALELRKLILGINSELTNQSSWRFFDPDYNFSGISAFSLPDDVYSANAINIEPVQQDIHMTNFIGVKIGDLDGDAVGCL